MCSVEVSSSQGRTERFRRKDDCGSQPSLAQKPKQCTTLLFRGCKRSKMTDLRLLTPFSCETRHSGFLQDVINTFPTPAVCTHRPPTRANELSRALTASKYSPLHCRDVVRSCLRSPRYILMSARSMKRSHGKEDCSGQPSLEKNQRNPGHICPEHLESMRHERTHVLVLFSLASKHSPLHLREVVRVMPVGVGLHLLFADSTTFVRDFEHFDNEIDLAGLKG